MRKTVFILVFIFIGCANCANAQEVQLATLQQGQNLQVFYGANALVDALNVANDGDLINLTAGTFTAPTIKKAVTIQGAGYVTDAVTGKLQTVINGDINIQPPSGDIVGLHIEGIYNNNNIYFGTTSNPITATACSIKKSRLNSIYLTGDNTSGNSHTVNCIIDQCRITNNLCPDKESENLCVRNSIINNLYSNISSASLLVENCIITQYVYNNTTAVFKNNVIGGIISTGTLSSTSSAYNNVFIQGNANSVANKSGNMTSNANTLFGYAIAYDDNKTYELTPSSQTTFLGVDGTQVGIYGSTTPFTNVPTNPQVIQKNIAPSSTSNGILNVSITVDAQ